MVGDEIGALDKIVTELGYYRVYVETVDGVTLTLSDCQPGRPGCSGGYDDDESYSEDGGGGNGGTIYMLAPAPQAAPKGTVRLLVQGEERPGATAKLDAVATKINEFAAPLLAKALADQRKATPSAKNLQIVKLLGPDGFYLAYGRRSKGGARVAWRGWLRRWIRHWILPWKND